eukprot:12193554-Alexandrium_andersonii.AAC.1
MPANSKRCLCRTPSFFAPAIRDQMIQALSYVKSRASGLLPRLHLFLRIAAQSASTSTQPL